MAQDSSFINLMDRLREGNDEAASRVFHRFARQLIELARGHLDPQTRQKVDPEDVIQSVFLSFFTRHAEGQFDLENWGSLWGMLTVLTVRKCGQRMRHFRAARRSVRREVSGSEGDGDGWAALDRDPTPPEAVALTEILQDVMRGLDASERPILAYSLQGQTVAEISERVARTERTVQRVLQRLRQRLERLCVAGEDVS
jgi:RNA polymerase sigma-70 factor (ECF subfamily)